VRLAFREGLVGQQADASQHEHRDSPPYRFHGFLQDAEVNARELPDP
jgi:hypothetical protein